eukprot:TRINITY_DN17225_c0_g1_i1.p1 TRINITY_DN17225_c0_g1~~TRINITY_DN17225_c0_g1_i1.p1  ORF type:complete len:410 (-),score=28.93 TRINITY_DN17225_c0_g1_i1:12-1241(-)
MELCARRIGYAGCHVAASARASLFTTQTRRFGTEEAGAPKTELWSFGSSLMGQLGHGNRKEISTPTSVAFFQGKSIERIACGDSFSMVVERDHGQQTVHFWGERKILKSEVLPFILKPIVLQFDPPLDANIKDISCGQYHSLILLENGKVYSFGGSNEGQVGQGNVRVVESPKLIEGLKDQNVVHIACGRLHSFAVTSDGALFSWGTAQFNQLGHQDSHSRNVPTRVEYFKNQRVKQAAGGLSHSMVLTSDNELFTFGRLYGNEGRFGINKVSSILELMSSVHCGLFSCFVRAKSGAVHSFGKNEEGQLGHGDTKPLSSPKQIDKITPLRVIELVAGPNHCFAYGEERNGSGEHLPSGWYAWGLGTDCQLGQGERNSEFAPVALRSLPPPKKIIATAAGWAHSLVLTTS